jgi:hypothetical protein
VALPGSITRLSKELPFALKVDLESYLSSVAAAEAEIYQDSDVRPEDVPSETFLFVAGVWHLWTHIDAQRWVVHNSLQLADDFGAGSIQAGSMRLSGGSDDVEGLRKLHRDFRRWLNRNDLAFVIDARSLQSVLEALRDSDTDGRRR